MKVTSAVFSCKKCKKNKYNLSFHKKEVTFKRKKLYNKKVFTQRKR